MTKIKVKKLPLTAHDLLSAPPRMMQHTAPSSYVTRRMKLAEQYNHSPRGIRQIR